MKKLRFKPISQGFDHSNKNNMRINTSVSSDLDPETLPRETSFAIYNNNLQSSKINNTNYIVESGGEEMNGHLVDIERANNQKKYITD